MRNFNEYYGYIELENPIDFGKFEAVGWFPYEIAGVYNSNSLIDSCCPPRDLFKHIEDVLRCNGIHGNKYVVIFCDKVNFGTEDFAIFFKDCYCKLGNLDTVKGYGATKLLLK